MSLIWRLGGRRTFAYPRVEDVAPPPMTIRSGRRSVRERRCFPSGELGAFGQHLPGSICTQTETLQGDELPPALRKLVGEPLDSPRAATQLAEALQDAYYPAEREWFLVFCLTSRNTLKGWFTAAVGGGTSVQVEAPTVLRGVLASGAVGYIIAHNHPSGAARPSGADYVLTARLKEAGALVGLTLVDHLVIGDRSYYSMAEMGEL